MQFSIENINNLKYSIKITIDTNQINNAINNKLIDLSKKINIDGFRKGKVPINIIKNRYGLSINKEILNDLMKSNFFKIISEKNINIAGQPKFIPEKYTNDKNFDYKVEFEIYPKINLKNLNEIKIQKPIVNINDNDINFILETLRKQKANWIISYNKVEIDNRITIDFNGKINNKNFEGGSYNDFVIILGQGRMIKEFENNIIGHKVNDKFNISVLFPIDYHQENLRNKNVSFNIFLKKVEVLKLPNIDRDFVKLFGIKDGSIEKLRMEIYKNMESELKTAIYNNIKLQVINQLIKENCIDIPSSLIEHEMYSMYRTEFKSLNNKEKIKKLNPEYFRNQAQKRIMISLLLSEVIRVNKIKLDKERIFNLLEKFIKNKDNKKISSYKNKKLINNIKNIVLEEQAIESILKVAKITDKITNFQNVVIDNNKLSII